MSIVVTVFMVAMVAALAALGGRNMANRRGWLELPAHHPGLRVYQAPGSLYTGPMELRGSFNRLRVVIALEQRASKRREKHLGGYRDYRDGYYTVLWVELPIHPPDGFEIVSQSGMAALGKMVGGQDIVIGDKAFDDRFIIRGTNTLDVKAFLRDARTRDAIASAFDAFPDLRMDRHGMELVRLGALHPDTVVEHLTTLTGRANRLLQHKLEIEDASRPEPEPAPSGGALSRVNTAPGERGEW